MTKIYMRICFALIFTIVFPRIAIATTNPSFTLRDIAVGSDAVVEGKVVEIDESVFHRGEVYTHVVVEVGRTATANGVENLSANQNILTLRHWGGLVEDGQFTDRWEITGTPRFTVGDRVVLFVTANGRSDLPLYGGSQGVYRVKNNELITDNRGVELQSLDVDIPVRNLVRSGFTPDFSTAESTLPVLVEYDVVAVPNNDVVAVPNKELNVRERRSTPEGIDLTKFFEEVASLRSSARVNSDSIYLNEPLPEPPILDQQASPSPIDAIKFLGR